MDKKQQPTLEISELIPEVHKFHQSNDESFSFPALLTKAQRSAIHDAAEELGLLHVSEGRGKKRTLTLRKNPPRKESGKFNPLTNAWEKVVWKAEDAATDIYELDIISFNVLFDADSATRNSRGEPAGMNKDITIHPKRRVALFQFLESTKAHLIALQEVTPDFYTDLIALPWVQQEYCISDVTPASVTPSGNLLLSKFIPMGGFEWTYTCDRKRVNYQTFKINDRTLSVGVVHLLAGKVEASGHNRGVEISETMRIQSHFRCDEGILLGDWNIRTEQNEVHANLEESYTDSWQFGEGAGDTHDRFNEMSTVMAVRSWKVKHGEDEIQPPIAAKRLDRIYLKKQATKWTFTKAEVLAKDPIFRSDCDTFNMYLSDHYALKATIKCAERPTPTPKTPKIDPETETPSTLSPSVLTMIGIGATLVGIYFWATSRKL